MNIQSTTVCKVGNQKTWNRVDTVGTGQKVDTAMAGKAGGREL